MKLNRAQLISFALGGSLGALLLSFATDTHAAFATAGNQLQLNWPADHKGWQLQSQTNSVAVGLRTNWSNINGSTQTNLMSLPLNATEGAVFFRLGRP